MREQGLARPVMEREVPKSKVVRLAKAKDESFRCTKWAQACINKSRRHATLAKVKEKSLKKVKSAKVVKVEKF